MAGDLILIVEDNEKNMKLTRDVLQFNGFFEHHRRFDGNQGAGNGAAGQLLQAQALLSQTFG